MIPEDEKAAGAPLRRDKEKSQPFVKTLLVGTTLCSGGMLGLAMPNLMSGSGLMVGFKTALLTGAASLVTYGVNRLAIDRGAPLANAGYGSAAVVSIVGMLVVGTGLASATYAGLTLADVEKLRLEDYAGDLSDHAAKAFGWNAKVGAALDGVRAVDADLTAKLGCEIESSCLSGRGNGGHGPVARAIEGIQGKAKATADRIAASRGDQSRMAEEIKFLLASFQSMLAAPDLSAADRRKTLQGLDAQIKARLVELAESAPLGAVLAMASELNRGVAIDARPEAQRTVNDLLKGHGQMLSAVTQDLSSFSGEPPAFPAKSGVTDSFAYAGHFWPAAAITTVTELLLPISLWIYTYLALNWAAYQIERPVRREIHEDDRAIRALLPQPEDYAPSRPVLIEAPRAASVPRIDDAAAAAPRRGPGRPKKPANSSTH